jgi:hypothetical protein
VTNLHKKIQLTHQLGRKRYFSMTQNTKRTRSIDEMFTALKQHISLLEDYARKVYAEGNSEYASEIVGKLRLLVTEFGSNKPLLLRLMQSSGIEPKVVLGGPPIQQESGKPTAGDEISLRQYLDLDAIGIRVPSGDFVLLNKVKFIRVWAEQTGSSHEDWTMDETLSSILNSQIYIGGIHGALAELKTTVENVLHVAHMFIEQYEHKKKE